MKTTLFAVKAGDGVLRIPSMRVQTGIGMALLPMVTALKMDGVWVPFIDGEEMQPALGRVGAGLAFHLCVTEWFHKRGLIPSIVIKVEGGDFV